MALSVPALKIFVAELATSSSLKESRAQNAAKGDDVQPFGDSNTPNLTPTDGFRAHYAAILLPEFRSLVTRRFTIESASELRIETPQRTRNGATQGYNRGTQNNEAKFHTS